MESDNSAQPRTSIVASAAAAVTITPSAIPTETPAPLPTQTPLPSPTATAQSAKDNCRHALDTGQAGPGHATLIKNETDGAISISLNLYTPNAFAQCGSISYGGISKNGSVLASLPAGNWYAYAWGRSMENSSLSFFVQPAQFMKLELCVRDGKIVYKQTC